MPADAPLLIQAFTPAHDASSAVTAPGGSGASARSRSTGYSMSSGTAFINSQAVLANASVITTIQFVQERQSFWQRNGFPPWDGGRAFARPPVIYPPYPSFRMMLDAVQWTRWDRKQNRYGETNVLDARNTANERTQSRIDRLMAELTRLFDGGRFSGGQNRDWLARGLEAAGRLGMIGAEGGPYAAVGLALAGFVMSACQDLWPAKKQQLLDLWQEILRDCLPLERYLLVPYMREIARACFRLEPTWNVADQSVSQPFRWGTQPQPAGHNIVGAGPLGICTFLGEILLEYDCFPEPGQVPVPAEVIEQLRTQARNIGQLGSRELVVAANQALMNATAPGATMEDPLYVAYVSAVIGADHPQGFHLRDEAHRERTYGPGSNKPVSPWVKGLWQRIRNSTVQQLQDNATALGIAGMSPTFYTRSIDRALVDMEHPQNAG